MILFGFFLIGFASALPGPHSLLPDIDAHIVGGSAAAVGEFPHQVAFTRGTGSPFCGGTWIKSGSVDGTQKISVLTAAHCVVDIKANAYRDYNFLFGLHKVSNRNGAGVISLKATDIIVHGSYNQRTLDYDIAMIHFDETMDEVQMTSIAEPIEIATSPYEANALGTVSGWGTTSSSGYVSDTLRYVSKRVWDLGECRTQSSMASSELTNRMLCCGETGKDACQGDSGGPLIQNTASGDVLIGVVSWGYGCGSAGYPGVYADVNNLQSWIKTNMQ